jgi:hypothetical protein
MEFILLVKKQSSYDEGARNAMVDQIFLKYW